MKAWYLALPSLLLLGIVAGSSLLRGKAGKAAQHSTPQAAVVARAPATAGSSGLQTTFEFLSTHGNSNCSSQFLASIPSMPDAEMLQGSCCSPMAWSRYQRQVADLKQYKTIPEIPSDPYDIPAKLAKELLTFDTTITPTAAEQSVLNDALSKTTEKGYCCCKCWRWNTYEGLSKDLVRTYHFSAGQVAEVLNDSNGCGGA